jgi:hypothetical protein
LGVTLAFLFFLALIVGAIVFWVWALVDCIRVSDDSMYRAGNKLIWVLVIVFLQWIGAIIYLVVGRPDDASKARAAGPGSGSGSGWGTGQGYLPPGSPGTGPPPPPPPPPN